MNCCFHFNEALTGIHELTTAVFQPFFDVVLKYYFDHPMLKIVLAFVPALLGIAYPLIIQTISRLNDQYKSTHIIERFKKERLHVIFLWSLRTSVFLTILCVFLSPQIFVLAFISVVFLLIVFFWYLNLLLRYQNGQDLFRLYLRRLNMDYYLTNTDKKKGIVNQRKKILEYWHPILDLFLYSINQDRKLENDIRYLFINKAFTFIKYSDQGDQETILFPAEFYNSTYDVIYAYLKSDERDYHQNIESFVGSIYFTDTHVDKPAQYLHQDTLAAIWRNLVLAVEHQRWDKILSYWKSAHQFRQFNFELPRAQYSDHLKETKESIQKRNKIEFHREAFTQLHSVLGAYLMYKKECKTLKELWFFTQSQPPRYVLIPQTTDDIFNLFFTFLNYEFYNSNIVLRFWFKDLGFDEMNNKMDVKFTVSQYSGLLFLRLYLVRGIWVQHPLAYPQIPLDQSEKREWEKNLDVFRNIVSEHLNNLELLECLGLGFMRSDWVPDSDVLRPLDYIDELKRQVKAGFESTLRESVLDKEKTNALDSNTVKAVTSVYENISRVKGQEIKDEPPFPIWVQVGVFRGTKVILNREAFINNSSIHHINADTILGEAIKHGYYSHFSSIIANVKKRAKYEVPNGQIFHAIDKLNLNPKNYVIISYGINLKYLRDLKDIPIDDPVGREDFTFRTIPIFSFDYSHPSVYNTVYLIEKDDLPLIKHTDWSDVKKMPKSSRERWQSMELIDDKLKIYRKFTELNQDETLRNAYIKQGKKEEELKDRIEVDVDFLGSCWFKISTQIIEIKETELFQEGGSSDNIDDIQPLE